MFYAYAAKFDMTGNLKNFVIFWGTKQGVAKEENAFFY